MADTSGTNDCSIERKRPGSDKVRLQKMRAELVKELNIVEIENLIDVLYSQQIFTTEEKNKVCPEAVTENKMRKLLDILEKKVDKPRDQPALEIVIDFLINDCGRENLAKKLIETDGIESKNPVDMTEFAQGIHMIAEGIKKIQNLQSGNWSQGLLAADLLRNTPETLKLLNNPPQTTDC